MSVPALVMNIFEPSIVHSPSASRAVVRSAGVGARLRLGQPERREPAAAREVGQPLPPLLLGAEQVDRQRPERVVRGDRDRDRRVDPRQLLDRDRVRERVGAAAAVLLRDRHPHQPELGELGDELVREALLAVELLGDRRDLLEREPAHGIAEQLVLGGEVEVHAERLRHSAGGRAAVGSVVPCPHANSSTGSSRVDATDLVGIEHSYRFDIEGEGSWRSRRGRHGRRHRRRGRRGRRDDPHLAETFERLVAGKQNPTMAYMTGKIKIDGDLGAAMKLQKLFSSVGELDQHGSAGDPVALGDVDGGDRRRRARGAASPSSSPRARRAAAAPRPGRPRATSTRITVPGIGARPRSTSRALVRRRPPRDRAAARGAARAG